MLMRMVFNNNIIILHQYGKGIALNGSRPIANNSWVWGMCLEKLRGLQAGAEVTTTTLWVATTRHNHTEDLSGEFRSYVSRHIQREGRRAWSRVVKMTAPEKHCEQTDVINPLSPINPHTKILQTDLYTLS